MILEEVRKNKLKTAAIIAFFITFVTLCVYFLSLLIFDSVYIAVIFGLTFSIVSAFVSYYNSDKMILSVNNARPATREENLQLNVTLETLCIATGLPKPKLYIMETDAMNAFATGRNPENSVICVTRGLLNNLDKYEMEGVLAHELSHIKNYDILVSTIAIVMVGFVTIIADMASRSIFFRRSDSENNNSNAILIIIGLIFLILSPIFGKLMQLAISRKREFLADATAIEFTRNPDGLISALQKISSDPNELKVANNATENMYIVNPFRGKKAKKSSSLWSTHPSTEDRIEALRNLR